MKSNYILLCSILFFLISKFSFPQEGQSALPFLLIQTSNEMNGMGYASVAHFTDDPLASSHNPAHLGLQSINNNFSFGYNYSNWLPSFKLDLWLRTYAINSGFNLKQFDTELPSISIGLGYSNLYMNYGKFIQTSESSPNVLYTFNSYDKSDQITFSIALDHFIKTSLGLTYKRINSNLSSTIKVGEDIRRVNAIADLFDWGLLIDVPFIPLLSKSINQNFEILDDLYPICDFSIGFMNGNLGQISIAYTKPEQADPLPRVARTGIGLNMGFEIKKNDLSWKPVLFKWTLEANDLLIESSGNRWEYQSGFGDIDFYNEIIRGKTNKVTEKLKGWQIDIFEIFTFYSGRFEEDPHYGNRIFNTKGWSLKSAGVLKSLLVFNPNLIDNVVVKYILKHIDIRYGESLIETDELYHPLNNTRFQTFNILLSN